MRLMPFALSATLSATLALHPALALACGPPPAFENERLTGVSVSVGRVTDVIWVPLEIDGVAVPEGAGLSLTVHFDGKVEGTTGCNRFTGKADLDAGVMSFGPLAVTPASPFGVHLKMGVPCNRSKRNIRIIRNS